MRFAFLTILIACVKDGPFSRNRTHILPVPVPLLNVRQVQALLSASDLMLRVR